MTLKLVKNIYLSGQVFYFEFNKIIHPCPETKLSDFNPEVFKINTSKIILGVNYKLNYRHLKCLFLNIGLKENNILIFWSVLWKTIYTFLLVGNQVFGCKVEYLLYHRKIVRNLEFKIKKKDVLDMDHSFLYICDFRKFIYPSHTLYINSMNDEYNVRIKLN